MSDSLLIFTFSPIQSFIAEARRAQDLFMGSRILSRLAEAAGKAIGERNLVYPADLHNDAPNVLVACIPEDQISSIITKVNAAMEAVWNRYVDDARKSIEKFNMQTDDTWDEIWERQTKPFWQVYWATAPIKDNDYKAAYTTVRDTLDAVKRSRLFDAGKAEDGRKDSLSGKRAALHTRDYPDARKYWAHETDPKITKIFASKVHPFGKEMLDAIGAVKRFSDNEPFLSTSSIAAADYLLRVKANAPIALGKYRDELRGQFSEGNKIFEPREESDPDWPFDGDLLYMETLTTKKLKDDYGVEADKGKLDLCRKKLGEIYFAPLLENPKEKIGEPPKYYAILVMDGDNMGKHIDDLLKLDDPKTAHKDFSVAIGKFSDRAPSIITREFLIYNGGDDVLCLLPLVYALPLAQKLTNEFKKLTGNNASAGIAISHHQSSLDAALGAAREAEKEAKKVDGKNAVCIHALKRSGETLKVRSAWDGVRENFDALVKMFKADELSSRFAYDTKQSAYAVPVGGEMWQAELKRLITRHRDDKTGPDPLKLSGQLNNWTTALPGQSAEELSNWLILARFIAQGGGE
ncbi:MAG: type III-B CRISPR-associated protein Cas10/Cmr2 [Chloroflexi bacterium]|nr:type III-B CRISPR-associated protein Cas10/Cmr2 [Chloroflexota bacterium]